MSQSVQTAAQQLQAIAIRAASGPMYQFAKLYHLLDEAMLRHCLEKLNDKPNDKPLCHAADGKWPDPADLALRVQRMEYYPGQVAAEDRLIEAALCDILCAIYEQEFSDDSWGNRPGRRYGDVVRALGRMSADAPVNFLVGADLRGLLARVRVRQLLAFMAHRILDLRILRLINRFLKSGLAAGGPLMPLLGNIHLHYVLDRWFANNFVKTCQGTARLIRYGDDFVVCFQFQQEAARFHDALSLRLGHHGLSVPTEKIRLIRLQATES